MDTTLDMLRGRLGGDTAELVSRQLGTDRGATEKAIASALPLLVSALARNSSTPEGAQSLAGALSRDHDGGLLDDVPSFLGKPDTAMGEGILRHVLGNKRPAVEQELGRQAGLDASAIGKLLPLLAPLVMAVLGRSQRQRGLDPETLASLLGDERRQAQGELGSLGGLAALLDSDADGDVTDDVARLGKGLLGGLLKRKR